jgi:hypothetical protein
VRVADELREIRLSLEAADDRCATAHTPSELEIADDGLDEPGLFEGRPIFGERT